MSQVKTHCMKSSKINKDMAKKAKLFGIILHHAV